jgi:DNA-binding XRE family transcriptional regulator
MSIHQRFIELIHLTKNKSINSFAGSVGFSAQSIGQITKGRAEPSFKMLVSVVKIYPLISLDWLILGDGPPFRADLPPPPNLQDQVAELRKKIIELQKAQTHILSRFKDLE